MCRKPSIESFKIIPTFFTINSKGNYIKLFIFEIKIDKKMITFINTDCKNFSFKKSELDMIYIKDENSDSTLFWRKGEKIKEKILQSKIKYIHVIRYDL